MVQAVTAAAVANVGLGAVAGGNLLAPDSCRSVVPRHSRLQTKVSADPNRRRGRPAGPVASAASSRRREPQIARDRRWFWLRVGFAACWVSGSCLNHSSTSNEYSVVCHAVDLDEECGFCDAPV